jgi:hypothetical protein
MFVCRANVSAEEDENNNREDAYVRLERMEKANSALTSQDSAQPSASLRPVKRVPRKGNLAIVTTAGVSCPFILSREIVNRLSRTTRGACYRPRTTHSKKRNDCGCR